MGKSFRVTNERITTTVTSTREIVPSVNRICRKPICN